MKGALKKLALAAWLAVGALLLSRWWYSYPDLFPRFPDGFWRRLDQVFGATNVDEAANVELLVVVVTAFVAVAGATAFLAVIFRRARKRG